jgi:2,3-bisphosphoglycerate-dependent phosphoglycerate mutase
MELYIIRHAQSTNNALLEQGPDRVADPPLTEMGVRQAQALAEHLATGTDPADVPHIAWAYSMPNPRREPGYGIARLYCSAMERSLQTARPVARALGLKPEIWLDIHEVGGMFLEGPEGIIPKTGKSRQDILADYPDYLVPPGITEKGWWTGGLEEQLARDVRAARVASQLRAWRESPERIAIISHGGFISRLLRFLFNEPSGRLVYHEHYNAAISRLEFRSDGLLIADYINRVDFLPREMLT